MRRPSRSALTLVAALALLLAVRLLLPPAAPLADEDRGGKDSLYRALGVFRVFAVDCLWIRMRSHRDEGRDGLVLTDARTILELEPDCEPIRNFLHWHLAFNMAHRATDDGARALWITEGIDVQMEGLRRNPDSAILWQGLGMSWFMADDLDDPLYRSLCIARHGRPPVEMAPEFFEKAWLAGRDRSVLTFLIQSLENLAWYRIENGKSLEAAEAFERAIKWAEEGLTGSVDRDTIDELTGSYREEVRKLRGVK